LNSREPCRQYIFYGISNDQENLRIEVNLVFLLFQFKFYSFFMHE